MRKLFVIELLDTEGEIVIEHHLFTPDEALEAFAKIVSDGILATMYELGHIDSSPNVISENESDRLAWNN